MKDDSRLSACAAKLDEKRKIIKGLMAQNAEMLAMIKAVNTAFYVKGTRKALQAALEGSKDLIRKIEGGTE